MKRLSAIILAIALAVSVMAEPLSAVWMLTGNLRSGIAPIALDSADTMTVVVTHWHASEKTDDLSARAIQAEKKLRKRLLRSLNVIKKLGLLIALKLQKAIMRAA